MATIAELRDRVSRMLGDPGFEGYDPLLFVDGLSMALDAILPWVPKTQIATIEGNDTVTYDLPEHCYEIEACVNDANGEMLPQAILIPGYFRGEQIEGTNDWMEYPHGAISFSKALAVGETYTLYYLAHWEKPVANQFNEPLEPPEYSHLGLCLYTTAYMILPSAVSAAEVRQWNTKVDSGNPEHNPMQQSTTYLLRLFTEEMNRHPRHQKAQK